MIGGDEVCRVAHVDICCCIVYGCKQRALTTTRALIEFMGKSITIIRWQRGNKWRNVRVRRIFELFFDIQHILFMMAWRIVQYMWVGGVYYVYLVSAAV